MLGRIYTFLFIVTILIALWYQRVYLNQSAVEFNAQLMAENAVLPTMTANNYNSVSFQDALFKSSFSGNKFTYFSNKHFEASENLVYEELNANIAHTLSTNLKDDFILIKTDKALGEVMSAQTDAAQTLMAKNTLKYAIMPNIVDFNLSGNIGQTSNVYFDALKKTLNTEKPFVSHGPSGNIKGVGFFYSMNEGDFIIKSDVDGMLIPTQIPKK